MPWTNASIVLNSRDSSRITYNNLTFNAEGQNIIQGQVDSIAVSEVNFPYDIPNIQSGFNFFTLSNLAPAGPDYDLNIVIPPGFYTGIELAAAIDAEILVQGTAAGVAAGDLPLVTYTQTENLFAMTSPAAPSAPRFSVWNVQSPATFPAQQSLVTRVYKDILSIMGYYTEQNPVIIAGQPFISGSAPLAFTQYIDICSPKLCQFQYFRDGTTTNLARRSDVICRLYISTNIAVEATEGTRPFVINRQFQNARVMRWTADNSVGSIDIQLYDDTGQPLLTTWKPRPYQITFNCYELSAEEGLGR
jgi:hypothetical protein